MLLFKGLSEDVSIQLENYYNSAPVLPTNLVIFSKASLTGPGKNDWTYTGSGSTNWIFSPNTTQTVLWNNNGNLVSGGVFTLVSTGAHSTTSDAAPASAASGTAVSRWAATSGSHSHTVDLSNSLFPAVTGYRVAPNTIFIASYSPNTSVSAVRLIPSNTIIFAESAPNSDCVLDTLFANGYHICDKGSAPIGGIGSTQVSNTYSSNGWRTFIPSYVTTSSDGFHDHFSSSTFYNATGSVFSVGSNMSSSQGGHFHSLTLSANLTVRTLTFKAFRLTQSTVVSNGMIFAYKGPISDTLPSNWYFCNGQTVSGLSCGSYTVPDTRGKFIQATTDFHNVLTHSANNLSMNLGNSSELSKTVSHAHYAGNITNVLTNFNDAQHLTYSWVHTHSISPTGYVGNYELPSRGYNFIIYLV